MKLSYYLKRNRTDLKILCQREKISSYEALCEYCKKRGLDIPKEEELNYEFKKNVEERPAVKSSVKKKRISNKKSSKPKTNDSISSRRSRSAQRSRKSSNKPQRKSNGGKVESVQPASGSEDTK